MTVAPTLAVRAGVGSLADVLAAARAAGCDCDPVVRLHLDDEGLCVTLLHDDACGLPAGDDPDTREETRR